MSQPGQSSLGVQLGWGAGSFATGTLYNGLALFGLFFLTSVVGIEPVVAGLLLFVTKLYDAFTDPLMGVISDRTRHPWGARRPYLFLGALLLGPSFALLFSLGPMESTLLTLLLVGGVLILHATAYTIFSVPYMAMPPVLALDYDARTRLMSFRVLFLMGGILISSYLGPKIVSWAGEGERGYLLMGLIFAGVSMAAGLVAFFTTAGHDPLRDKPVGDQPQLLSQLLLQFKTIAGNGPFMQLMAVKLCKLVALASVLASTPYLFRYVLEFSTGQIGNYLLVFSVCGVVSIPFWRLLMARFGKRDIFIVICLWYAAAVSSWFFWTPQEAGYLMYVRALFIGFASTGTLLAGLALLPDTMEYGSLTTGTVNDGAYSGVFTTIEKLSGALGPLIVGALLSAFGLIKGQVAAADQPESALFAVRVAASLVPAALSLAAIPILWRYSLTREQLQTLRTAASQA